MYLEMRRGVVDIRDQSWAFRRGVRGMANNAQINELKWYCFLKFVTDASKIGMTENSDDGQSWHICCHVCIGCIHVPEQTRPSRL